MKPLTTANASVFATIVLLILFNLPYVGIPAALFCLIFFGSTHAGRIAKIVIVANIIFAIVIFALGFIEGFMDLDFPLIPSDELEAFRSIFYIS